jgi:hypothetical protein
MRSVVRSMILVTIDSPYLRKSWYEQQMENLNWKNLGLISSFLVKQRVKRLLDNVKLLTVNNREKIFLPVYVVKNPNNVVVNSNRVFELEHSFRKERSVLENYLASRFCSQLYVHDKIFSRVDPTELTPITYFMLESFAKLISAKMSKLLCKNISKTDALDQQFLFYEKTLGNFLIEQVLNPRRAPEYNHLLQLQRKLELFLDLNQYIKAYESLSELDFYVNLMLRFLLFSINLFDSQKEKESISMLSVWKIKTNYYICMENFKDQLIKMNYKEASENYKNLKLILDTISDTYNDVINRLARIELSKRIQLLENAIQKLTIFYKLDMHLELYHALLTQLSEKLSRKYSEFQINKLLNYIKKLLKNKKCDQISKILIIDQLLES